MASKSKVESFLGGGGAKFLVLCCFAMRPSTRVGAVVDTETQRKMPSQTKIQILTCLVFSAFHLLAVVGPGVPTCSSNPSKSLYPLFMPSIVACLE